MPLAAHHWNEENLTKAVGEGLGKTVEPLTVEHHRRLALDSFGQLPS